MFNEKSLKISQFLEYEDTNGYFSVFHFEQIQICWKGNFIKQICAMRNRASRGTSNYLFYGSVVRIQATHRNMSVNFFTQTFLTFFSLNLVIHILGGVHKQCGTKRGRGRLFYPMYGMAWFIVHNPQTERSRAVQETLDSALKKCNLMECTVWSKTKINAFEKFALWATLDLLKMKNVKIKTTSSVFIFQNFC